jgi:hypothetical protein
VQEPSELGKGTVNASGGGRGGMNRGIKAPGRKATWRKLRRRLAEGSDPRRGIKISAIEKLKIRRKKAVKTAVRVEICNGGKDENWEISLARPGTIDGNHQIWSNFKKPKEKQVANAEAEGNDR